MIKYPEKESSRLEFKEKIPRNDQIIKTIIGFCNHFGGKLVLGVDDKGLIKGIDITKIDEILEFLEKSIFEACFPPIIIHPWVQTFHEKSVIVVEVSAGMNRPYYIKSLGVEKGTFIRLGHNTLYFLSNS